MHCTNGNEAWVHVTDNSNNNINPKPSTILATDSVISLAMAMHSQPTCTSTQNTNHWIHDTYSPVFQAIDHLAVATANILAVFPSKPNILAPAKQKKPNLHLKQQHT